MEHELEQILEVLLHSDLYDSRKFGKEIWRLQSISFFVKWQILRALRTSHKYILENQGMSYEEFTEINDKIDEETKVYLWDLAGQPFFRKIRNYYMSHAFCSLTIFDLNKPPFEISGWLNDVRSYSPKSDFLLVGNKSDLINEDDLLFKDNISALEKRHNTKVHIVSAKSAEGVRALFIEMKVQIMKRLMQDPQ